MDNLVDCPIDGLDLTPFVLNEDEGAVVYRLYAVVVRLFFCLRKTNLNNIWKLK